MIFSCENCQAKFDVDPDRIKDGGSKVRCSQCKHVFTIYKPAPEQAEWEAGPEEDWEDEPAAEEPRDETPESEPEPAEAAPEAFEEEAEDDLGLDDFGPTDMDKEEAEAPIGDLDDDLGLDDLGLGEPEEETGDFEAPSDGLEDDLGLDDLGLEPDDQLVGDEGSPEPGEDVIEDDLGFDDLGLEPEDEPPATSATSSHGVEDLEDDLGLDELGLGEPDDMAGSGVDEDVMDFGEAQDDLGIDDIASDAGLEPDEEPLEEMDWEPPDHDLPDEELPEDQDDLGLPPADDGPAVMEEDEMGEADVAFIGPDEDEAETIAGEFAPPIKAKKRRTPWFFIVLLILVAGLAGVYFLAPQFLAPILEPLGLSQPKETPKTSAADPKGNQKISPEDAKHFFRQNESEGQLLIITGLAKNQYDDPRSYIRLKGLLHDAKGKVLAEKMIYCGNILSEEQLMSLPMDEIDKALNVRDGENGANVNVPPGGSVQFMVVFSQIPNDLAEYAVEVFSSQSGQKTP
jgi:predicted Zn finger-like uncharacterized protein